MRRVTRCFAQAARTALVGLAISGLCLFASANPVQAQEMVNATTKPLYVGSGSTEATLKFDARLVQVTDTPQRPGENFLQRRIDQQLSYLIGPMRIRRTASAYGGHDVRILSVKLQPGKLRTWDISYHYEGRIILVDAEQGPTYTVYLPFNPSTVYQHSFVNGEQTCTEGQHPGADLFFYSWLPDKPGCSLVEGTHYQRIDAQFERKPNTELTFPEYDRLKDSQGFVSISLFQSKEAHGSPIPDPAVSDDSGARDFMRTLERMRSEGYETHEWSKEMIRQVAPVKGEIPRVYTLLKTVNGTTLRVTAFFGETDLTNDSSSFHYFWKHALENDSMALYTGHSGIGKNLHLGLIEKAEGFRIALPTDRYQLVLFGGCVSYSYYPRMYFARKATDADPNGTRQFDILSNGAESYFGSMSSSSFVLLDAVESYFARGNRRSYQQIAEDGEPEFLYGILGDEDNPTE